MPIYKNAEIRLGGNVIRSNVEVESLLPITGPSAGKPQWSGVLRPPNNTGLLKGEVYTLVLPGFSLGKIEVTEEANPSDGSVPFKGVGDMPRNKAS